MIASEGREGVWFLWLVFYNTWTSIALSSRTRGETECDGYTFANPPCVFFFNNRQSRASFFFRFRFWSRMFVSATPCVMWDIDRVVQDTGLLVLVVVHRSTTAQPAPKSMAEYRVTFQPAKNAPSLPHHTWYTSIIYLCVSSTLYESTEYVCTKV